MHNYTFAIHLPFFFCFDIYNKFIYQSLLWVYYSVFKIVPPPIKTLEYGKENSVLITWDAVYIN